MKKSFKNIALDLLINPIISIGLSVILLFCFVGALVVLGSMSYFHGSVFLVLQNSLGIRADYFIVLYVWLAMLVVWLIGYFALVVFAGPLEVRAARKKYSDLSIERQWRIFLWGIWYEKGRYCLFFLKRYVLLLLFYSVLVFLYHLCGLGNMFMAEPNNIRNQLDFVIIGGIYMIITGVAMRFYLEEKYEVDDVKNSADGFVKRIKN